eukprot:1154776-Pelagomonas_calceolata.AAC.1
MFGIPFDLTFAVRQWVYEWGGLWALGHPNLLQPPPWHNLLRGEARVCPGKKKGWQGVTSKSPYH